MLKPLTDRSQARLDALLQTFEERAGSQVGYPCNQDFDYSELLPFLQYAANNVGDPFRGSNFGVNTHEFEQEVIASFADLMGLPQEEAWGYVTSGGTEGNMYGLYMARELFPDGTVYFSQDTHYSIPKILRVLNMRSMMIRSQENGEIDYEDLRETLRIHRETPVIFMANIGTTMKGAVDDLDRVGSILLDLGITRSYIHSDAALSGMILPFVPVKGGGKVDHVGGMAADLWRLQSVPSAAIHRLKVKPMDGGMDVSSGRVSAGPQGGNGGRHEHPGGFPDVRVAPGHGAQDGRLLRAAGLPKA